MGAAERYREFVTGLAAERPRLHVAKMMRVRWLAAADQARLAIRLFLVGSARAAHMTAESADARLATSARSLSRSAAECSASSIAAGLFLVVPRNRPFPDSRDGAGNRVNSRSRPSAGPHAVMSVASRSSSPAIPTSVNSASDGHKSGQRPCVGGSPSLQSDTPANPRRSIRRRSARAPSSN